MKNERRNETEAVSPVIGVILMVAITVILAAVIGTFVLGLGDDVQSSPAAGVTTNEVPGQTLTFTITSTGNLDGAIITGPDGNRSADAEDVLGPGVRIIIDERGFPNSDTNVSKPPESIQNQIPGDDLVGDEECLVRHGEQEVRGATIGGADIGCSAQILEDLVTGLGFDADFAGDEISYEADARYRLVGVVDGNEGVIQTVTTSSR